MTEVKASIAAIRADVDKVKVTVKENKQNQHRNGSNQKINLGMLHLLETLTFVSDRQNKQMEKMKASMKKKPHNIHHFWNQMEQKNNETKDKMKALSRKVDDFIDLSDAKKEDLKLVEKSSIERKGRLIQDVKSVLSNISHKVIEKYLLLWKIHFYYWSDLTLKQKW